MAGEMRFRRHPAVSFSFPDTGRHKGANKCCLATNPHSSRRSGKSNRGGREAGWSFFFPLTGRARGPQLRRPPPRLFFPPPVRYAWICVRAYLLLRMATRRTDRLSPDPAFFFPKHNRRDKPLFFPKNQREWAVPAPGLFFPLRGKSERNTYPVSRPASARLPFRRIRQT